ncbi:MAG: winged helix DNA-binding domain-containing protein [Pyrinomonadaceae bacterium]
MRNQKIFETPFSRAVDIVSWLGAVQAQDYSMAKWAIGLRLSKATVDAIEDELDAGSIVRTHVLRPTWHFVSAADVRWMLDLTAPRIEKAVGSRRRQLELDAKTLNRSTKIIARALEGANHLTRTELMAKVERSGIKRSVERSTHLMFHAELEGVVCNGKRRVKQLTYALMDERVPKPRPLSKDEALATLALRYFTSHGPATLTDFTWWSGLAARDARSALDFVKADLSAETVDGQKYWMPLAAEGSSYRRSIHLLPAFDEFTVSYKDRSASVSPDLMKIVTVGHAIFRPIIVIDGRVAGIWARKYSKKGLEITYNLFEKLRDSDGRLLERSEKRYRSFNEPLPKTLT